MSETTLLRSIKLKRVSIVDSPANEHARVVLYKRADVKKEAPCADDAEKAMVECPKCGETVKAGDKCPECGAKLPEAAMEKGLDLDKIEDPEVKKAVEKLQADLAAATTLAEEEQTKRLAAEAAAAAAAKVDKAAPAEDDIFKGMSVEARKRFEKLEADNKASVEAIAKMNEEKREAEYVAKARAYGNLSLNPKTFGPILKRCEEGTASAADVAEINRVLEAANAAAKKHFSTVGKNGTSTASGAYAEILALAKAKREEVLKSGDKLSLPDAQDLVIRENPDLYKRYLDEQRAASPTPAAAGQEE